MSHREWWRGLMGQCHWSAATPRLPQPMWPTQHPNPFPRPPPQPHSYHRVRGLPAVFCRWGPSDLFIPSEFSHCVNWNLHKFRCVKVSQCHDADLYHKIKVIFYEFWKIQIVNCWCFHWIELVICNVLELSSWNIYVAPPNDWMYFGKRQTSSS